MPGRYTYYIISCICLLLVGCDRISEDERLIYEKPEPAQRVVLLEDFTGQRCTNCPKATEVIAQLQETYGDALVAVGIHGGPLAFAGNAKVIGLKTKPLRLGGNALVEGDAITIHVYAEGTDGTVVGKLQVWLLEDGIQTLQLMPDGSANQTYIHNHVFRTAVNGLWGDDFSVGEGERTERTFTQDLEPAWNKGQLSVVAFVYNDSGVQQAVRFN